MLYPMTLKRFPVPEHCRTHTAGERSFPRVRAEVQLESHTLGKSLLANVARVGPLTGVGEHVPMEIGALRKFPATHFARVGLLSRVRALVNVEVICGGKLLWAHRARIRLFAGVSP